MDVCGSLTAVGKYTAALVLDCAMAPMEPPGNICKLTVMTNTEF
jgi:hypothetical protein